MKNVALITGASSGIGLELARIHAARGGDLNVGSMAGFLPGPFMAVYYATKAFVLSFSGAGLFKTSVSASGVAAYGYRAAIKGKTVARSHG